MLVPEPAHTVCRMDIEPSSPNRDLRIRRWTSPVLLALVAATIASIFSFTAVHSMGLDSSVLQTGAHAPQEGTGAPQPVPQQAQALVAPPPGGLTLGFAGTTSPAAVLAAQTFEVASITALDRTTQQFLVFIPGAPDFVNTLKDGALAPDMVVIIRRAGNGAPAGAVPVARGVSGTITGTPFALEEPPTGGLTMGMAGTTDLDALIDAQGFDVSSVSLFHLATQRWLVFIPGAPDIVNTLTPSTMSPESFVAVRRAGEQPEEVTEAASKPEAEEKQAEVSLRSLGEGRISYYYCQKGSISGAWGDGGGWCGHFASGARVYEGGAACAREYRGQRFKIAGDPLDRIYVCEDIGGAVHGNTRDIFFHNSDDAHHWYREVGYRAEIFVVED